MGSNARAGPTKMKRKLRRAIEAVENRDSSAVEDVEYDEYVYTLEDLFETRAYGVRMFFFSSLPNRIIDADHCGGYGLDPNVH